MTGAEILLILRAVSAGIDLAKLIAPRIEDLFSSGKFTPEEQMEIMRLVTQIRDNPSLLFTGPNWNPSTQP